MDELNLMLMLYAEAACKLYDVNNNYIGSINSLNGKA